MPTIRSSKTKTCANCDDIFHIHQTIDGVRRHFYKRTCTTLNQRQRRLDIKQEAVDYKGGSCQMCNYAQCLDALDFHHLDPNEKDLGIAQLRKRLNLIKAELDKCILVCSNCHRELHHAANSRSS